MSKARDILRQNGKSFYFASLALDRSTAERCARLYAFCRLVDDIADESEDKAEAQVQLKRMIAAIRDSDETVDDVADIIRLAAETGMSLEPAIDLINGVMEDLSPVRIQDIAALHRYCYRVAGTVGLLMCGVLGVQDRRAYPFAIDLGIGMQLTNIARDVLEDACAGRRYIPASIIGDVPPEALAEPDEAMQARIADAVCWLLGEADRFYRSGEAGLVFLPPRAALCIRIASRVYHRIGVRLRAAGFSAWRARMVVSLPEKILIGLRAFREHLKQRSKRRKAPLHTELLHRWLRRTTSIYW